MNYPYHFIQLGPDPPRLLIIKAGAPHLAYIKLASDWSGRHMTYEEAKEYLDNVNVVFAHPEEYE